MNNTILIVEDNRLLLKRLERTFSEDGYEVITATTVEEGIKESVEMKPDLILLDLNLPDGIGLDILRNLKESDECPPTVIMTGEDYNGRNKTAFRLGVHEFLEKPLSIDRLKRVVRHALNY